MENRISQLREEMKVKFKTEFSDIASVYIAEAERGKMIEFVESTQPPFTREEKWVLIVSTLFGCPVDCSFCDAGGRYDGKLTYDQVMFQIDYLISKRFRSRTIPVDKFKIQFSRVGEPAFNPEVLRILEDLPRKYIFRSFIPSISTVGPAGCDEFFEGLLSLRKLHYPLHFQLQFSIHSTDENQRDMIMPVRKWSFAEISEYCSRFYVEGGHKISLNFALAEGWERDPLKMLEFFDPQKYLIKITPVNPTYKAREHNLISLLKEGDKESAVAEAFRNAGYDVILSIGEWEENRIGSNCGQYIGAVRKNRHIPEECYTYCLENVD